MEFTVKRFDLLRELTLIQGVVERKTTIPILANVLVRAEEDRLGILATDLEIGLKSTCPSAVTAGGTITLPAKSCTIWTRSSRGETRSPSICPPPSSSR